MNTDFQQIQNAPSAGFTPMPQQGKGPLLKKILIIALVILIPAGSIIGFVLIQNSGFFESKPNNTVQEGVIKPPPGTRPLDSYTPQPPWEEGDPINVEENSVGGGLEPDTEI